MDNSDNLVAASLKLPPFWTSDPEMWFLQVESLFELKGITNDRTKFNHIVSVLEHEVASQVLDLLRSPPSSESYNSLRYRLIAIYKMSDFQRMERLFSLQDLGTQRPSALLATMVTYLPNREEASSCLFRYMFISRMPSRIRDHLLAVKLEDIHQLAQHADLLWQTHPSTGTVSTISEPSSSLCAVVPRKKEYVTKPPTTHHTTLCWYHRKFGKKANYCQAPCSWSSGNGGTGGTR